jgi:hypothetical protein
MQAAREVAHLGGGELCGRCQLSHPANCKRVPVNYKLGTRASYRRHRHNRTHSLERMKTQRLHAECAKSRLAAVAQRIDQARVLTGCDPATSVIDSALASGVCALRAPGRPAGGLLLEAPPADSAGRSADWTPQEAPRRWRRRTRSRRRRPAHTNTNAPVASQYGGGPR